jgi:outer membrane protein assembly factor BamB
LASESPAGIAVAGGFVVVACHVKGEDQVRCYKVEDGDLVWTHSAKNAAEIQNGPGPRATPLIHEGRVYSLSAVGECSCLDLAKGTLLWNLSLPREFKVPLPSYGHCGSLLIADGKLIVSPLAPAAAIAALDPATGKVLWQTKGAEMPKGTNSPPGQPHSSYIVGTFGEVVQIAGYDWLELAGWELATGKKLWSVRPENNGDFNVGTPVNVDGKLLVATDNNFTRLFGFEKGGKIIAKPEALNDELAPGMATPVYHKNLIFGSGDDFLCLDPKTLKTLWVNSKEPAVMGFTMVIAGNERILVLNEEGDLALVTARADKCELLGKLKVCGKTWSHPALADGKLYVRDKKVLYCYSLK